VNASDAAVLPSDAGAGEATGGTTVVVGAAQGIGAEVARRLAGEAWTSRLVLADVNLDAASEVADQLAAGDREATALACDITDPESRGRGAIVAIASIAARMPRKRQAAYCASKAGMRHGLRVLGMEVAPAGVRVNTVSPGATDTPMMRALAGDHPSVDDLASGSLESMRPPIPHGRVARTADVAQVVSFLLAPGSEHIFLQDIVVDGGELLGM
jgi:NAD(P)-dependent dehydrogenase (short-subunit alcohol dehydrogenase family)